ncbi:MAG: mersacidin/lichenicidin family type 2 lantibiotic, partial [Ktedonobacteraceae bacterium]|nr:mersacidin/lichenicidin family type 2 lantibiotic [Ktedonobacteraceae bacterium]
NSLSAEELAQLPENPAGAFELSADELETVHGAWGGRSHEGSRQFVTAFLICLNTVVAAVCINNN